MVSIIIPSFQRRSLLERAINSVLSQTYKNYELIIVDDGSTDGTFEWLSQSAFPCSFKVLYQKNAGVSTARNLGLQISNKKWVAFLDSDDEWLPTKLEEQIMFSKDHPQIKVIHTEELWFRNNTPVPVHKKYLKNSGDLFLRATQRCVIGPSTVLINTQFLKSLNGFDESYPACEDYELWLRVCILENVGLVNKPLIKKHAGAIDQLSNLRDLDYWRVQALHKLIQNKSLKNQRCTQAKSEIVIKLKILSLGYEKYHNPERLLWAKNLLNHYST